MSKMVKKSSATTPRVPTDGTDLMRVLMTCFMPSRREISRSGRSARKVRRALSELTTLSAGTDSAMIVRMEMTTTQKSSTFQPERR